MRCDLYAERMRSHRIVAPSPETLDTLRAAGWFTCSEWCWHHDGIRSDDNVISTAAALERAQCEHRVITERRHGWYYCDQCGMDMHYAS
jgi:hypothetical protein